MSYVPKYDYRAKDALPSGNTAKVIRGTELMEEFEGIRDSFIAANNQFADISSKGIVASCKYNGTVLAYNQNVTSVANGWNGDEGLLAGQYKVNFETSIEGFDEHYAPVITPFPAIVDGNPAFPVIAVLQGFTATSVTFTLHQFGGDENGAAPETAVGFSLLIVDMVPAGSE